ncbi:MAG TPA: serine hydrolase [Vicinamibacteria bacterium]|nr:serine hydrolase [Vicinamibacteria bacterium]
MGFLAVLLLWGLSPETEPPARLRERFEEEVRRIATNVDGVLGVAIRDLTTGESYSIEGDTLFTQASAIKLPILVELFRQAEEEALSLDQDVTVASSDIAPGSGVLQQLTPGRVTMPLRDIATLMVTVSDNTATNLIIERVGMENVNRTMARLGLHQTKLQRKMMDEEAWAENRENLSTPNEQADLLQAIHEGKILGDESRKELLGILAIPKSSRIRPLLPTGTRVAHKTGSLAGVVVDVGIIYLKDRPFIVAAMGNWLQDEAECERAISEIARRAYEYFDRLAHSNAYGHRR